MDWIAQWRAGHISFHEGRPNELLEQHRARLAGRRVLVPLCGRSEDLAYLAAHGHEVVGIELAELAVREFFALHGLQPEITPRGPLVEYRARAITMFVGDVFAATREMLGPLDAYYDRAALVALDAETRPRYAAHVRSLLPAGAPALVIAVEYEQSRFEGPPWSVTESALRALYPGAEIEALAERPLPSKRLVEAGTQAIERCYAFRL